MATGNFKNGGEGLLGMERTEGEIAKPVALYHEKIILRKVVFISHLYIG